jgi:N-methylhydantoinase B/oxoprolinase/acetone carboxylase alpha subunit
MTNKHKKAAWGLKGGKPGMLGRTLFRAANGAHWQTMCEAFGKMSPSKYSNVRITPGDRMVIAAPGGGGYGEPCLRDPAMVSEDVREGYISERAAREAYGVKRAIADDTC